MYKQNAIKRLNNYENYTRTYIDHKAQIRDLETGLPCTTMVDPKTGHNIVYRVKPNGEWVFLRDATLIKKYDKIQETLARYNNSDKNKTTILLGGNGYCDVIGGVTGKFYVDKNTQKVYVIRSIKPTYLRSDNDDKRAWYKQNEEKQTLFYMDIDNAHLIRRTDGQIIKDKFEPQNSIINIKDTDDFIRRFNMMQDNNKKANKDWKSYIGGIFYNHGGVINYNNHNYDVRDTNDYFNELYTNDDWNVNEYTTELNETYKVTNVL